MKRRGARWLRLFARLVAVSVVASLVLAALGMRPAEASSAGAAASSGRSVAASEAGSANAELADLRARVGELERSKFQVDTSTSSDGGSSSTSVGGGSSSSVPDTSVPDGSVTTTTVPGVTDPPADAPDVPTVVEELTTETRLVTAMPDGSFVAEISAAPVRVQDETGEWDPIDVSLVETAEGLVPETPLVPVVIGEDLRDGFVTVGEGAEQVEFSFPQAPVTESLNVEALEEGSLAGENALGAQRDLEVQVTPTGFKDTVTLESPAAGSSYVVELSLPAGAVARDADDGVSVEVVDASGGVIGSYSGGLAWDSSGSGSVRFVV